METIIGIDLGTTNSEVAVIRDGQPVVLEEDGDPILPSVVGLDTAGPPAGRQGGPQPVRPGAGADHPLDQAEDGSGRRRSAWETRSTARRKSRRSSCGRSRTGREGAGAPGLQGRDHRARLLQRRPARGHARGRRACRTGGRSDHQRADRGRVDLRPPPPRCERLLVYDLGGGTFDVSIAPGREGRRGDPRQPRRHPAWRRRL